MTPILAQRQRPDRVFERMYRRHVGDVYRYALAVMRNQADAEDVTQTTFMNAYRAFQRGEQIEKPQNWLITIAHNVCRQRFRQSARRPTEVAFDDDIGSQLVEPEEDTPTGEDIRRALAHLAFNQRAALVMRELEGRSYAEIAEILDLSGSAVETLIFRARRALREQLETSLTCGEAELAISRQLDGRLPRKEKGALRAHLRECKECATFARRQRAQRAALKSLAAIPVPTSLTSLFGGGGAAVGGGVAVKAAVALTAGVALGGAGYTGVHHAAARHHHGRPASVVTPQRAHDRQGAQAGLVPAPREHMPPGLANGRASDAASIRGKSQIRGHRPAIHGDASISARHADAHRLQPARNPHRRGALAPNRTAGGGSSASRPVEHTKALPGPYDGGPPPQARGGRGKGK
jgi:RNA polymerase sigma factor (sigma-70 family)